MPKMEHQFLADSHAPDLRFSPSRLVDRKEDSAPLHSDLDKSLISAVVCSPLFIDTSLFPASAQRRPIQPHSDHT